MNQYPLVYLDHVHKNYGDAPALYELKHPTWQNHRTSRS